MAGRRETNGGLECETDTSGDQIPRQSQRLAGLRIPTVSEALPFTPFSSIVPFNPDIIPPPLTLAPPSTSSFPPTKDVIHAKEVLEQLCAGATRAKHASERCRQTLQDVQKLLDPENLTKYTFRQPKHRLQESSPSKKPSMRTNALSPFAKLVYDKGSVEIVHNAPTPPPKPVKQEQNGSSKPYRPMQTEMHVEIPVQRLQPQTPSSKHSAHSPNGRIAQVIIPNNITPEERAQYRYIDVPDEQEIIVKQIPHAQSKAYTNGTPVKLNGDNRHKNDAAVQNLQNLLYDIFEAEDGLEADTSGNVSKSNSIFATRDTENGSVPVLQHDQQLKLDIAVQKVASAGRIEDIEIDHLSRVQRICESAVVAAESASLTIGDDWSDQDVEEWQSRIDTAGRALIASRTLLRIMGAGAHIKELQSEDFLAEVVSALRTIIENFFVPLVEERALAWEKTRGDKEQPPANPKFIIATDSRRQLQVLLNGTTKALRTLGSFLSKSDVDESTLSSVQYFCKLLIFAENATSEKDSVLGIQNFETARKCAMDVIASIYVKYSSQRQFIVDEILTSLEKLPATKQSARQFALSDCKPIQLVSALLMRLVQTSATYGEEIRHTRSKIIKTKVEDSEDSEAESEEVSDEEDSSDDEVDRKKAAPAGLPAVSAPLNKAAQENASYIIRFLIQRALTSSKSAEEPFRRLLDIFTQDFLEVLGSSDWPAAELLLRNLVMHFISIAENSKSGAASRVMALELLGTIGSGILQLQKVARNGVRGLDTADSILAVKLGKWVVRSEAAQLDIDELCDFDGPFRTVVEYLQNRNQDDPQLKSAQGYHLMQWATLVANSNDEKFDSKMLEKNLRSMILNPQWLQDHHDYIDVPTKEGRLASILVTLNSVLFKSFDRMFRVLILSMRSEQPTIRSRSLKSIAALLETDPSILDRKESMVKLITISASDQNSSLVRSSAIGLLERCTSLRPSLDPQVLPTIIERTAENTPSVRKAALNLLTKFYQRNANDDMHAAIARAIIARIGDTEDSMKELARNTMEQIWFQPLYTLDMDGERAVAARVRFNAQAALFVNTIRSGTEVPKILEALIKELLTKSKAAQPNSQVCKTIIQLLFDGIVDNSDLPGQPTQGDILSCLTVFAKACPKLFTAAQLERLEPYTQNLSSDEDLKIFAPASLVLQQTLPFQMALRKDFLEVLQIAMYKSIAKLPSAELAVAVSCMWTLNRMLDDTDRLVKFLYSALRGIHNMRKTDFNGSDTNVSKVTRLMRIVGAVGGTCDLDSHIDRLKTDEMPSYNGGSVSGLIVQMLCPFTVSKQPLAVREVALEAVCIVAQEWPKLYLRPDVVNVFETVFADRVSALEQILLTGLENFYSQEDVLKGAEDVPELGTGVASGTERLGRTYLATDRDSASTSIAQRFLDEIRRLALSSYDETAFIAARVVVSINKHSLVMPKLSGPALVALETCPNPSIANLAFNEHKEQHAKRESLFEKEYMRAVEQVFKYQTEVIQEPQGYSDMPPVSKMYLLWEVLKTGKAPVRKKFLGNLSQKLDFDPQTHATVQHAAFVRFCCENLAFFDYDKMDDILHLLLAMGKTFSGTGTAVAQTIESEVLRLRVDTLPGSQQDENAMSDQPPVPTANAISQDRLQQLASSAQALSMIWETKVFIQRLWNMQKYMEKAKHTEKGKAAKEKDINRTPIKSAQAQSLTDAYLARIDRLLSAMTTVQGQHQLCSAFIDTISVDTDVRTGSDAEEDGPLENGFRTPSEGTGSRSPSAGPGSGRPRKRKSSMTASVPRKKGRPNGSRKKSLTNMEDDESEGGWD